MKTESLRFGARLRRAVKFAWIYGLYVSGAISIAKMRARRSKAVLVLAFHRVLEQREYCATSSLPGMVVRDRTFGALMRYLARCAHLIDLRRPDPLSTRGKGQSILITFDDGWLDTCAIAFRITQGFRIPIAVFVCSGLANRRMPFWPERYAAIRCRAGDPNIQAEVESLKQASREERDRILAALEHSAGPNPERDLDEPCAATMSWTEVERLAAAGACIGSHTHTHPILTCVPLDTAEQEIKTSKDEIARRCGSCDTFAYPNGDWSAEIRQLLQANGYEFAFTTESGWWTDRSDRLAIPRINISEQKIAGLRGNFSRAVFEYHCFWRPMWRRAGDIEDQTRLNATRARAAALDSVCPSTRAGGHA